MIEIEDRWTWLRRQDWPTRVRYLLLTGWGWLPVGLVLGIALAAMVLV